MAVTEFNKYYYETDLSSLKLTAKVINYDDTPDALSLTARIINYGTQAATVYKGKLIQNESAPEGSIEWEDLIINPNSYIEKVLRYETDQYTDNILLEFISSKRTDPNDANSNNFIILFALLGYTLGLSNDNCQVEKISGNIYLLTLPSDAKTSSVILYNDKGNIIIGARETDTTVSFSITDNGVYSVTSWSNGHIVFYNDITITGDEPPLFPPIIISSARYIINSNNTGLDIEIDYNNPNSEAQTVNFYYNNSEIMGGIAQPGKNTITIPASKNIFTEIYALIDNISIKSNVVNIYPRCLWNYNNQQGTVIQYKKGSEIKYISSIIKIKGEAIKDITSLSWEEIIEGADNGRILESCVGQEKTIMIGDTSYDVVLIGVNHDDLVSGGKANTTWQLKHCYNTKYPMNSSDTNSGGYAGSEMHTTTLPSIFNQIQEDVRSAIKSVIKKASVGDGSTTIVDTNCNLFLLSEKEICNSTAFSASGEGTQYAYWKQHDNDDDKRKGLQSSPTDYIYWWMRSPSIPSMSGVYPNGFCMFVSFGNWSTSSAWHDYGVSFAFCI